MSQNIGMTEAEFERLLKNYRSVKVQVSPFFASRVSARVKANLKEAAEASPLKVVEETRSIAKNAWMHWLALGVAMAGGVMTFQKVQDYRQSRLTSQSSLSGIVGIPTAITVFGPTDDARGAIRILRVSIPEKLKFHSEKLAPLVEGKHQIELALKPEMTLDFPIMVLAQEEGEYSVRVEYFSKMHELLGQKTIKIKFEKGGK